MAFQCSACSFFVSKLPLPLSFDGPRLQAVSAGAVGLKTRMTMFRVLSSTGNKGSLPNSNYVVPLDKGFSSSQSSVITRPLAEILRDLNKRVSDNIVKPRRSDDRSSLSNLIPCMKFKEYSGIVERDGVVGLYRGFLPNALKNLPNSSIRLTTFDSVKRLIAASEKEYSGWCGQVHDVIYSDIGSVTVVYRIIIHGSDGEAHRESTGNVMLAEQFTDPVTAAEEIAFCRACARFGLGLYLYHVE